MVVKDSDTKVFYLYILRLSDRGYYTGITNNIVRRMREHTAGQSISTRNRLPIATVYYCTFNTRSKCRYLEVLVKMRGANNYLSMNKNKFKVFYTDTASNQPAIHHEQTSSTH